MGYTLMRGVVVGVALSLAACGDGGAPDALGDGGLLDAASNRNDASAPPWQIQDANDDEPIGSADLDAAAQSEPTVATDASEPTTAADGGDGGEDDASDRLGAVDASADSDAGAETVHDAGPERDSGPVPCTKFFWYRDADHDGYGSPSDTKEACRNPAGYVSTADDCYDGNALANPGQTEWFTEQRGDGSFDYDCNGTPEKKLTKLAACPALDDSCPPPTKWPAGFKCDYEGMTQGVTELIDGWTPLTNLIPACGENAEWSIVPGWDESLAKYTCTRSLMYKRQLCR